MQRQAHSFLFALLAVFLLAGSQASAYYDPATGRFLSPDPARFADSRNLYAYCANDPVNGYDPDGLLETQLHNEQQPASAALPSASNPISSATPSWSYAPDPTADGRYGYVNRTQGGAAATLLALGDMLGVTTAYEAMTGRNLSSGQWLTGAEQRQSGLMAVVSLATLAMPAVALESRAGVGVGGLEARAAMEETEAGALAAGAGADMQAATMAAETADTIAPDLRISPYRVTMVGETFPRFESSQIPSRISPNGSVAPNTFAGGHAADSTLSSSSAIINYNLPRPDIIRDVRYMITPPQGTWIIGRRPVAGGIGDEVVFPFGVPPGSATGPFPVAP